MVPCKFILELKPPTQLDGLPLALVKIKPLLNITKHVGITSRPLGQSISGFDLSYRFASFLSEQIPSIDILFHLTCHDLNKINIQSRLDLLRRLGVDRILVVTGDGYELSPNASASKLQFRDSHELVSAILMDYKWFKTIAIAGYPGGNGKRSNNDQEELDRLSAVIELGVTDVYTQCVFGASEFLDFRQHLKGRFPSLSIVPSIALFKSPSDLEKISRLLRVTSKSLSWLKSNLDKLEQNISSPPYWIIEMNQIFIKCPKDDVWAINLCPFGHYDLAERLMSEALVAYGEQETNSIDNQ